VKIEANVKIMVRIRVRGKMESPLSDRIGIFITNNGKGSGYINGINTAGIFRMTIIIRAAIQ